MVENGRVHPDCVNAANSYHECGVACLEKIAEIKGRISNKKSGTKLLSLSGRFEWKKKGTEPHIHITKNTSSETSRSSSTTSEPSSEEINSHSQSSPSHPDTWNNTPDHSNLRLKGSTRPITDAKRHSLASLFSYRGPPQGMEHEENKPLSSVDSCVMVGKYRVRESVAPTLQSIVNKYGDISENCHLESLSIRAYYLECLCSVVQEMQSTPITQLTKGKVKGILAVLKDVRSAQIDITWLHSVLDQVSDVIDLTNQYYALESAKEKSDNVVESTKMELQSHMEDLALKEKSLAEAKAQVEETKACFNKLELECFQLNDTIASIKSKVDTYLGKSAAAELL